MKRIASILAGLSLAALFFAPSAHAQYDAQKMTANIPFEFTVGNISLPAGQYEFQRTGFNIYLIRDANGLSRYTASSVPIEAYGLTKKRTVKFVTMNGRHFLVQIWNGNVATGSEFQYRQSYVELAKQPTIHATVTGATN
jgi:hypothetical protein